jgi:hypothetical protein
MKQIIKIFTDFTYAIHFDYHTNNNLCLSVISVL